MKSVIFLYHVHEFEDGYKDLKLLGVFASEEDAWKVVPRYKKLRGFKDVPEGFVVREYELGKTYWNVGYKHGSTKINCFLEPEE